MKKLLRTMIFIVCLFECVALLAEAKRNKSQARSNRVNRVASMQSSSRNEAARNLPDIRSFKAKKSERFLIDLDVLRTGHPYKGKYARRPHTGGHVYFKIPDKPIPVDNIELFPAIYAVADGVISRIDFHYRLREMYEPALGRRVANARYGIGLMFAAKDGSPISFHYSIEPFIDPGNDKFYDPFILVKPGQRVKKGDVIARMYIPPNRKLAQKSHIHFNLIGGKNYSFMAPSIFTDDIVKRFHTTWGHFGTDADVTIPPCMGFRLAPDENPFGSGKKDAL